MDQSWVERTTQTEEPLECYSTVLEIMLHQVIFYHAVLSPGQFEMLPNWLELFAFL